MQQHKGKDEKAAGTDRASTLAIVVGTFNRLDQLKALIESIRKHVTVHWELHISDAGSSDGTREWLMKEQRKDPRTRVVLEARRTGQAAALNEVFETLSTGYVCWLSDDNVVVGGALDLAVAALAEDRLLGMIGLKVKDRLGPFADASYIGGITSTGVINVNQGVLRTGLLQTLGGFNTDFRDYGIDADLTTRVLLSGHDVAMTREIAIEHFRNWPDPGTPAAERHEKRNEDYRSLYNKLYGRKLGSSGAWIAKRGVWKLLRLLAPKKLSPDRGGSAFGRPVRDWHNLMAGRFVSLQGELRNTKSNIHLRQRAPRNMV